MNTEASASRMIDVNDSNELADWSSSLDVSSEQLKGAVAQVGNLAADVQPYLRRNEAVEADTAKRNAGK